MSSMKYSNKERKSLCEESMLVFVNILKLSSLSIARRTLVRTSDDDNDNDDDDHQASVVLRKKAINSNLSAVRHRTTPSVVPVPNDSHKKKESKRSQKPEQPPESKLSYVMLPEHDETATVDDQFTDYIRRFHKKTESDLQNATVEGKAANFIKRFHDKNKKDLNNESTRRSHYVLPPPPPQVFK